MPLPSGARLGPYEVLGPLGSGGMGEVYRGRDTRLDRPVAIKICHEQFSDRFHREARAISALNHPHICTLYDVGPDYLVLELVEGVTLADRLTNGPLAPGEVVTVGAQIADALSAAHTKGIVHRDLKPANIMLTKAGAKVLDFGLAKVDDPRADTIVTRGVVGTPAYMAPEQVAGLPCDARTDVFALGLVLYEMALGRKAVVAPGYPLTAMPVRWNAGRPDFGQPEPLFRIPAEYDVAADGQRFLVLVPSERAEASPLYVITHWESMLNRVR
jgi:serine/threonine protein kinase